MARDCGGCLGVDRGAAAHTGRTCGGTHPVRPGAALHAPYLLDIEVAQVLRRFAAKGDIDGERGRMALDDLSDLRMHRYPHEFLLPRVWALRHSLTGYDAVYVALAEALDCMLLTRDHRLPHAAGHHAQVQLV